MNQDSFFSIDRLVDFGLGLAVSQQMVNSMNQALQNMHVPGLQTPMIPASTLAFHVVMDGKAAGPFNDAELSSLIAAGRVTKDTLAWRPGMVQWEKVESVPAILRLVALCPPPVPPEA